MDFFNVENIITIFLLCGIEVVLAIDNSIYIIIASHNFPPQERDKIKLFGFSTAIICRIFGAIFGTMIIKLSTPFASVLGFNISIRSITMSLCGIFLIVKGISEIIDIKNQNIYKITKQDISSSEAMKKISIVNLILSIDSMATIIGMTDSTLVALFSIIISVLLMMMKFGRKIGDFIYDNMSLKILSLCIMLLIGTSLIISAGNISFDKTILFCAIFFALFAEFVKIIALKSYNNTTGDSE